MLFFLTSLWERYSTTHVTSSLNKRTQISRHSFVVCKIQNVFRVVFMTIVGLDWVLNWLHQSSSFHVIINGASLLYIYWLKLLRRSNNVAKLFSNSKSLRYTNCSARVKMWHFPPNPLSWHIAHFEARCSLDQVFRKNEPNSMFLNPLWKSSRRKTEAQRKRYADHLANSH